MTDTPTVSVVIPVNNGAATIRQQLEALEVSLEGLPAEILLVDNRSTDGTASVAVEFARRSPVETILIPADERAGEPYARNTGWRAARGDQVLFCDADDVVSSTWARALSEALATAPCATGPLETRLLNAPSVSEVRGQSLFRQKPLLYGRIPFAHGANMGFRRQTLELLGGFDESFRIGCDIELAIRAHEIGLVWGWAPDAVVHYRLRSTPRAIFQQARAYAAVRSRFEARLGVDRVHNRRRRFRRSLWVLRHAPDLLSETRRLKWFWVAGQVSGESHIRRVDAR